MPRSAPTAANEAASAPALSTVTGTGSLEKPPASAGNAGRGSGTEMRSGVPVISARKTALVNSSSATSPPARNTTPGVNGS